MSRSFGLRWLTTRSPILIRPLVISSSPAIMRRSVDLPHPEGPTSTTNSPSSASMLTLRMTLTEPKDFSTFSILTPAMRALQSRLRLARVDLVTLVSRGMRRRDHDLIAGRRAALDDEGDAAIGDRFVPVVARLKPDAIDGGFDCWADNLENEMIRRLKQPFERGLRKNSPFAVANANQPQHIRPYEQDRVK